MSELIVCKDTKNCDNAWPITCRGDPTWSPDIPAGFVSFFMLIRVGGCHPPLQRFHVGDPTWSPDIPAGFVSFFMLIRVGGCHPPLHGFVLLFMMFCGGRMPSAPTRLCVVFNVVSWGADAICHYNGFVWTTPRGRPIYPPGSYRFLC